MAVAEMTLQLRADTAELARMHAALETFAGQAGLPDDALFHLNLALDELVTNTISYGFGGCDDPRIDIAIRSGPDRIAVVVRDNGTPFDPFSEAPEPDLDTPLAARRIGGLGVHLVKQFMDRVSYRRKGGQNCLEMSLPLER